MRFGVGVGPKRTRKAEENFNFSGESVADCVERRRCARPVVGLGEDREHQWPPGAYRSEQGMKVRPWTARSSSKAAIGISVNEIEIERSSTAR